MIMSSMYTTTKPSSPHIELAEENIEQWEAQAKMALRPIQATLFFFF
jgi:hypothetical protein